MNTEIARRCKKALEAVHAMIYFTPESAERFEKLGLEAGFMSYFAGRAAPMGAVGPGVVAATFYNFNPDAIALVIPKAWSIASPADVVAARFDAADAALHRMLGEQTLTSDAVSEAAKLAREAAEACRPGGKPLFAGLADLTWPEATHLQLWHAITLLREFRGDAHLVALQAAGLTGLQALVLQNAAGDGLSEKAAKLTRGWSDEQWDATRHDLRDSGLVDDSDAITEQGKELREQIESVTDSLSMAPWNRLGEQKIETLTTTCAGLSKTISGSGVFPSNFFVTRR